MSPPLIQSDSVRRLSPRFARSRQMVDCLRNELLYSEKRARDVLFEAVARLVAERPPMMASQLTREATILAREISAEAGFEFENWDPTSKAVVKAMLLAEALLTPAGSPIQFGVAAQAAIVGGLCQEYCDRTEAFLLEFLIGRLGDVTTRDHTALAHALFRQFDPRVRREDLEDRVVILLARLEDRVVLAGKAYALRELEQA
jgi:hypothetical protein